MQRAAPRSYRVPIVILSAVLFVLVTAIVVVQAGRAGRRAAQTPCPVGEWDVVDYREAVRVPALPEPVEFTGGEGTILRLRADGTGATDYGAGVSFTATAPDGRPIRLEATGPVFFRYELAADGGSISVRPDGNEATTRLFVDGDPTGPRTRFTDDPAGTRSFRITCTGGSLVQDDGRLTVEYRRR